MKYVFLSLFLVLSLTLMAQQKFIEVNVTDTMLVSADLFVYQINIIQDEDAKFSEVRFKDAASYAKETMLTDKKIQKLYDSVINALTTAGYVFSSPDISEKFLIQPNPEFKSRTAYVIVSTIDSLNTLYRRLQTIKNLTGNVVVRRAKNEEMYRKQLLQKLLDKATAKAKNLADMSGLSIGSIQSIIENETDKPDAKGGWSAYPPLSYLSSAIPGWHTTINPQKYLLDTSPASHASYTISDAITVRFSIQ